MTCRPRHGTICCGQGSSAAFTAVSEGITHFCDLIADALIAASHHADPALEVTRHDAAEKNGCATSDAHVMNNKRCTEKTMQIIKRSVKGGESASAPVVKVLRCSSFIAAPCELPRALDQEHGGSPQAPHDVELCLVENKSTSTGNPLILLTASITKRFPLLCNAAFSNRVGTGNNYSGACKRWNGRRHER